MSSGRYRRTGLERFSTPFAGFYLYYPQRRNASPALRALIEYLRGKRRRH
jgi:DNA-binding transcriptional LysR family regulator